VAQASGWTPSYFELSNLQFCLGLATASGWLDNKVLVFFSIVYWKKGFSPQAARAHFAFFCEAQYGQEKSGDFARRADPGGYHE
jgi:hypothetical protein